MQNTSGQCQQGSSAQENTVDVDKQNPHKKKRKRNKNKNKSSSTTSATSINQPKIENLLSKTFLEKIGGKSNSDESENHSKIPKASEQDQKYSIETSDLHQMDKTAIIQDKGKSPKNSLANRKTQIESCPEDIAETTSIPRAPSTNEKSREQIKADREAKKMLKQAKKKTSNAAAEKTEENAIEKIISDLPTLTSVSSGKETPRDEVMAQREAKKLAKQAAKENRIAKESLAAQQIIHTSTPTATADTIAAKISELSLDSTDQKKKPSLTKAERRAIQEAQRAAKAIKAVKKPVKPVEPKKTPIVKKELSPKKTPDSMVTNRKQIECKVKLFNHLESFHENVSLFVNDPHIHPAIVRLGEQFAKRTIVGSNARCIAFLNALKLIIKDFQTPPKKEFSRSLESSIQLSVVHLQKCRLLAVSVSNAYKHIKHKLRNLRTDKLESELKENLFHFIDTYIEHQIDKAAEAISSFVQDKISDGDVILTFACSSLITYIFEEAQRRKKKFRVIIVDSRPFLEGQELLRRLTSKEIPCSYLLINAISFVMPEVTKILLGAHALLSNGYVMARTGTSQVALVAHSFNVPVLVCCETHKFCERFQTDAIVYNELGNPDDLIVNSKCCLTNWRSYNRLLPLNLNYDITPPELVTAVFTEVSILPCTSVPVILRIKPTEIDNNNKDKI